MEKKKKTMADRETKDGQDWVIEAEHVSYAYEGNDEKALDNFSLKIQRGKKVAFMGGNGSGKSTFFLCLNGIRKPDKGRIIIDKRPVVYRKRELLEVRKKVGIVFQEPDNQLFSASVYQEISFGILNLGVDEDTARRKVEQVIEELGISPFRERPVHALSGGQKKQVAIADILAMSPEVMILDEPAAALDSWHTNKVRRIVDDLAKRGITVLVSTHDMDYAYGWADEIVLMHRGQLIGKGTPLEVCSDAEALKKAGLEMPAVLKLYGRMKQRGILSSDTMPPANMEELEDCLANAYERRM